MIDWLVNLPVELGVGCEEGFRVLLWGLLDLRGLYRLFRMFFKGFLEGFEWSMRDWTWEAYGLGTMGSLCWLL